MKVSKAIDMYLSHVKSQHAPKTHATYTSRLRLLLVMYGAKSLAKLKAKHVKRWIDAATHWPDGREKAPDTIRLTVLAWEQLQKFLIAIGKLIEPIFDYGPKPGSRKRTRIPTTLEQARIFRAARRKKPAWALLFRCLRLCGARPGELANANIEDYDRERRLITLKEHKTAKKTGQAREIGVGTIFARLLDRAIGDRETGPLFLDEKSRRWKVEWVSRVFRETRDKLGISREIVLYCTRHEHGTAVCKSQGIHAAQHSLGHRDIGTTQRYVHPDPAELARYQDRI